MSYKNFAGLTASDQDSICTHVGSKYYSKSECAAIYGVSARTIGRVVDQGLFKNSKGTVKVVVDPQEGFKVGDIITCLKSNTSSYSITTPGVPCKVIALITDYDEMSDIIVEVLTGNYHRSQYYVKSKYFEKVGDVSVKVPSTKPKTKVEKKPATVPVESELDKLQCLNDAATFIKVGNSLMITYDGFQRTVSKDHPQFNNIVDYVLERNFKDAVGLMDATIGIKKWAKGDVTIDDGVITYKGHVIHNNLANRISQLMGEGDKGFEKFANFLTNLLENPSFDAVNECYEFLKHNDIEFTDDGCFYAYKGVTHDFKDHRTKTFDNSVGAKPEMLRNQVDPDRRNECSHGLHVCALHYLGQGMFSGEKVVKVKVNAKDVVAIPRDYDFSKMRLSTYEVVEDVTDSWRKLLESK